MQAIEHKLAGSLDFSPSRRVGTTTTLIGKQGQILRRLNLCATENCAFRILTAKVKPAAEEVLDRLAGRSEGVYLASRVLHSGETYTLSDIIFELPIELGVMGAPGKLYYEAFIQEEAK